MNSFAHVPPGFRFHPTDEELVDYYLRKKISSGRIDLDIIKEIDLYKIEPWDLQEKCKLSSKEQNEWYFFSHKDKKYPTGTRTNRATTVGFWKATGRDKAIYCKQNLVGMRKTLVFYEGRAPNGQKSDYIMHEYRLETNENAAPQEEGWVVCRVFKKRLPTILHKGMEHDDSPCWYDEQAAVSFAPHHPKVDFLTRRFSSTHQNEFNIPYMRKKELELHHHQFRMHPYDSFLQLPQLESPKVQNSISIASYGGTGLDINNCVSTTVESSSSSLKQEEMQHYLNFLCDDENNNDPEQAAVDDHHQAVSTDWRVLEKFVASQLVQQDNISASSCKERPNYSDSINGDNGCNVSADDHINILIGESHEELEPTEQCASTSATSSCQINLWK